ncbi:MAG: hypothetical protein BWY68_00186 [bacterium ADurb.Bin400]|nr:MAG: hypothetical protein BWY68_00186 [bacterium ADurb.Bin400]
MELDKDRILHRIKREYDKLISKWKAYDSGNYLPRWLLIALFLLLFTDLIGKINSLNLGSYYINTLFLLSFVLLLLLPRNCWVVVIVASYLLVNYNILPRSFGMVHADHRAYLEGPLNALAQHQPFYEVGKSENPYMPWSALIFWPLWYFGVHDMRLVMVILTALTAVLFYRVMANKPEGLLFFMVLLLNGAMFESNFYMYLANASFFFFLVFGIYFLSRNERSLPGAILLAFAVATKQQALLIVPFVIVWWIKKRNWQMLTIFSMFTSLLFLPFMHKLHDVYRITVLTHSEIIPEFYYSNLGNFWKFASVSLYNVLAMIVGSEKAWSQHLVPVNIFVYMCVFVLYTIRVKEWRQVIYYYVLAGALFFALSLTVNWSLYYLFYLALLPLVAPVAVEKATVNVKEIG